MFSVGDQVKYIGNGHGNATGAPFEPDKVGVIGTITYIAGEDTIRVRWPEGSTRGGRSGRAAGDEFYTYSGRLAPAYNEQQICVGDDVEFIDQTAGVDHFRMFPPVGTIGTVVEICGDGTLIVVWPDGTATPARGCYCNRSRVRKCSPRQEVNKELDTLFSEFEVQ